MVFEPPLIPAGAVNVTFRLNDPATACNVPVCRVNVPRRLTPLKEPTPSAVVPVNVLPANVNWGTPVTVPVVEPDIVTSSARASPWARVKRAMAKILSASGFTIERIRFVMILLSSGVLSETLFECTP